MLAVTRRFFGKITASGVVAMLPISSTSAKETSGLPAGACDCHVHIVGPSAQFPMSPQRAYTPPEASVADLIAMRERLGIARNVLIQPSFYGTDNRCMLEAMAQLGGSARGVAVVAPDIDASELAKLDAQGVRGIRMNLESGENRDPKAAGAALDEFAKRIRHLGWHIQIYAALPVIAAIADRIAALPVDVVIDHFGLAQARDGIDQPGFAALLDLVGASKSSNNKSSANKASANKAYVKLSAPYRISQGSGHADVAPIARALIAAGPDRMLWASDWPHTDRVPGRRPIDIHPFRTIDDSATLALLRQWCGDETIARTILVETPARLYGF